MIASLIAAYEKGAITGNHLVVQCLHLRRPIDHNRGGAVPIHALVGLHRLGDLVFVIDFLGLDLETLDPAFRVDQVVIIVAGRTQRHTIDLRRPGSVAHLANDNFLLIGRLNSGRGEPDRRANGERQPRRR